ncbi:hypothetical protein VN97_g8513 [Penicillium thymicola]|uniref:Uncharacterized protein n=1 Tax=Penicillium thymicola TaxID=293382 RepID=A0AAI9X5W1_PENTH|nr:hypothetical protein VN97_g8513 [Penicillium thymicola]
MFLCAVGLLALSLLQLVHGIGFLSLTPTPTPTLTLPDRPHQDGPQITPGVDLRQWAIMRRDDDLVTSSYQRVNSLCGWHDASFSDDYDRCGKGLTCAHHVSNSNWPGMIGCCESSNCAFLTACYGANELSISPDLGTTTDRFTLLCTLLHSEACVTYNYGDFEAAHYGCGTTSANREMFTFAIDNPSTGTISVRYDHTISTVDDDIVSSYASRFSSTPNSQVGDVTMTSSSEPSDSSESSEATQTSEPSSSPSEKSTATSAGAIAGGVVGGVAGGAAIALAGVFLCLRRKKRRNRPEAGGGSGYGGGPQSMSESQPSNLTVGMQLPAEMESRESPYQFSQSQDTASANTAHEMQGDTHPVVEADSNYASHSKDNAAELPAESRYIRP